MHSGHLDGFADAQVTADVVGEVVEAVTVGAQTVAVVDGTDARDEFPDTVDDAVDEGQ